MLFREATTEDIPQIQRVRHSVKENILSDRSLVTDADCKDYLTRRGKGWVCEDGDAVVGFAIADLKGKNIWALFLHPDYEGKGIGRKLHQLMMEWYFSQTKDAVWLSTEPNSRAERFYRIAGWTQVGTHGKGETKFEMTGEQWQRCRDTSPATKG